MGENTITLKDDMYNAAGIKIANVASGSRDNDVVNIHQLYDLKRYTQSELYTLYKVMQYQIKRIDNKLQKLTPRGLEGVEKSVWTYTPTLIEKYGKSTEVKDWRLFTNYI